MRKQLFAILSRPDGGGRKHERVLKKSFGPLQTHLDRRRIRELETHSKWKRGDFRVFQQSHEFSGNADSEMLNNRIIHLQNLAPMDFPAGDGTILLGLNPAPSRRDPVYGLSAY